MLVLTRHIDEVIWIGDNVRVKVLGICGDTVRIGIAAPRDVAVDREEIGIRKREELISKFPAPSYESFLADPKN